MTHSELKEAVKTAMKNKEAAATNEAVAKKRKPDEELSEDELMTVISRGARQRKDSIEQFEKGGRPELAAQEKEELAVLEAFLPTQLSMGEVEKLAKEKAAALGITDKSKANQLMGALMKDLKGRADGNVVKAAVEKIL